MMLPAADWTRVGSGAKGKWSPHERERLSAPVSPEVAFPKGRVHLPHQKSGTNTSELRPCFQQQEFHTSA